MKIRHTLTARIAAFAAIAGALCLRAAAYEAASQADLQKFRAATGGDEVRKIANADGTYDIIHIFTNTAEPANLTVPQNNAIAPGTARILVVGGGGAGSGNCGGGGGAGGLIFKEGLSIPSGTHAITVGAGGAQSPNNGKGNDGNDSKIVLNNVEIKAFGGGAGGMYKNIVGNSGGSGGGGSGSGAGGSAMQINGEGFYGNAGGKGADSNRGGGGGGAGSVGGNAVSNGKGGDGGAGLEFTISGESKFYAAGGGGGTLNSDVNYGIGGSGIGGNGKGRKSSTPAGSGVPGTGSGGGGAAGGDGSDSYGGAGGSGVIIVRYTVVPPRAAWASVAGVVAPDGSNEKVYSFTDTEGNNGILLSSYAKVDILVVGGGGAGANPGAANIKVGGAGGGGAGEMLEKNNVVLAAGEYLITVGKGGVATTTDGAAGENGAESKIIHVANGNEVCKALGGGGGGIQSKGSKGGSGGGGSYTTVSMLGGVAEGLGYVNEGGLGIIPRSGGGGGGAGKKGGDASTNNVGGEGGEGRISNITGADIVYAAGGGGGSRTGSSAALGGSDIGGKGGAGTSSSSAMAATAGADGTGSGGGGGSYYARAGGAGGSGIVIIRVKEFMPEAPKSMTIEYDGSDHTIPTAAGYTIKDSQGKLVEAISAREVGEYEFTVTLNSGYKCWADGSTVREKTCVLTITKPRLRINSFSIEGWQIGMPPSPVVIDSVPALQEGEYVLKYSAGDDSWTEEVPAAAGNYRVKLEIKESNNFDPPDSIPDPVSFTLWDWDNWENAPASLGYHAKFTVSGHSGEAMDAWVLVKFAEDSPLGFKYKYANRDGSDLRFTDESGNLLSFDITEWNAEGESTVMVQIPSCANGSAFYACWGELEGMELPQVPAGIAGDAAGRSAAAATPMMTQPGACFRNRWIMPPSISRTAWNEGEGTDVAVTLGEAVYGTAYYGFKPLAGALIANAIPAGAGEYTFMGCVDAGSEDEGGKLWGALYDALAAVTISGSSPYETLDGMSGNATLSGRVLLANDYDDGKFKVVDQSYYITNAIDSSSGVYWVHENPAAVFNRPYLKTDTISELKSALSIDELCGGVTLWYLNNIYIGNDYNSALNLNENNNYLPWSQYAKPISSAGGAEGAQSESAHLVMRNTTNAEVYSPCYTNGIGTIYFDAVNSATSESGEEYKLVLEVCKKTKPGKIPTDENVEYTTTEDTSIRERYGNAVWEQVELLPLVRNGTRDFIAADKTNELALAINKGGTYDNFYRVCAKVNYRGPIRFRIKRVSVAEGSALTAKYILLDNIIVSYPAMRADMEPCGEYDSAKRGPKILGQALAWSVPFPSVTDTNILARGKATYTTNPGNTAADTAEFFTGVKMHYRWRYLEQETGEWQTVGLDHKNGFKADEPLELPVGREGDVEFFFESFLKAPYYEYVDYSGAGVGLSDLYTENISVVTNRANTADFPGGRFPGSLGTDWFVRLREGKSSYESIRLVAVTKEKSYAEGVTEKPITVEMAVVGDNMWRGYLKTVGAIDEPVKYRFELINRQEAGAESMASNSVIWCATANAETLPASDILTAGGEDSWATIPCDGVTGYILFQIDEKTRALTAVHADYQNFNAWHDAKGDVFVGTSIDDTDPDKAGASAKVRECAETFDSWRDMSSGDNLWNEAFSPGRTSLEAGIYVPFPSTAEPAQTIMTPNGWFAGHGMYVYGKYKNGSHEDGAMQVDGADLALQMRGQGRGYVEFTGESTSAPRGLETVSFNARLAQSVNFEDIAYFDAPTKAMMTNYTFLAAGAFDADRNKSFTGNASLSLFAYYRRDKGCYEFRVEQAKASGDGAYNPQGQRLSIYRWSYDSKKKLQFKLLQSQYVEGFRNRSNWPECAGPSAKGYQPLFISLQNSPEGTRIVAGYKLIGTYEGVTQSEVAPKFEDREVSGQYYNMICCIDSEPERLTGGTYGLLSANSIGYLAGARVYNPVSSLLSQIKDGLNNPDNVFNKNSVTFAEFAGEAYHKTDFSPDLRKELWVVPPGRMATEEVSIADVKYNVLKNEMPEQCVNIYTASPGKSNWRFLRSVPCNTFGTTEPHNLNIFTNETCLVRFAAGGTEEDVRTDVVIDNITLKQFRGDSWKNAEAYVGDAWERSGNTNIIFTTAWIKNKSILVSARRTTPAAPASIRSPLFDGTAGTGLGMFSFSYENAQENVKLILQVATNGVNQSIIDGLTDSHSAVWETYKDKDGNDVVFDFSEMTPEQRKGGTLSVYLGLHGVRGVMRLVMDPKVVEQVQGETDPSEFGEIYITSVLCRDEPVLDPGSWWGWNIRTLGGDEDSEKRMLLTDVAYDESSHGMALALNNSVTANVVNDPVKKEAYKHHQPFVQTPTFTRNVVGEIAFKARRYGDNNSQPAEVALYGSYSGRVDDRWKLLKTFAVSNSTYKTFSYKTAPTADGTYTAFRLAVTGVEGVSDAMVSEDPKPQAGDSPVRVLIDEVVVSEAVRARIAFRNVGAFRSRLDGTDYVPNVPSASEQPLCNESWGVQCEVFAAQLADEIDFTKPPTVRLHWFQGEYPWGFANWRGKTGARSGMLVPVDGTNLIYRSSLKYDDDSNKSVVDMAISSGTVVQYELEVVYYQKGSPDTPITNYLSSAGTWLTPEWYAPVDKNAGKGAFSAYSILDTVAPKWAWINEINILGDIENYNNTDKDCQYVEVAVPAEADISGWSVRILEPLTSSNEVITNTIGRFGTLTLPGKKENGESEANMVFRVLGNVPSRESGRLKYDDGTLDAVWDIQFPTDLVTSKSVVHGTPLAVQLVRSSGILEHEIVFTGTNKWSGTNYEAKYHPTNTVNALNRMMPGSSFKYVGDDDAGSGRSLSVLTDRGQVSNNWSRAAVMTPGRINEGQVIDPNHPTPNGSQIFVYANLDTAFGHIYQTVGDAVNTNRNQIIMIQRGSLVGTNITYTVDPWYELGSVTTNNRPLVAAPIAPRTYQVTVGVGASNSFTVVASAKIRSDLESEYGLTPDNKYRNAIMKWLETGKTAKGPWRNAGAEEIYPVEFRSLWGTVVTNLTLTQIYWLDIDPTISGQAFVAGMSSAPVTAPTLVEDYMGNASVTNVRMGVKMYITNTTENAEAYSFTNGGTAYAPYTLRGIEPGSLSMDWPANVAWTSVTFKVAGILANGLTSEANDNSWVPLRWFMFGEDSFDENFITQIEVWDPFSKQSPGYSEWYKWLQEHPGENTPVFFKWAIDTKLKPFTVEPLRKVNFYGN